MTLPERAAPVGPGPGAPLGGRGGDRLRIKICGLTSLADAEAAAAAGADLLGFVFHPASPRALRPEAARAIVAALRPRHPALAFVGVFVDRPLEEVRQVMAFVGLDLAQLHGREPPEAVAALGERGIKAVRVRDRASLEAALARYRPGVFLLDAWDPDRAGGTGRPFPWALLEGVRIPRPWFLAGGLTPENVGEAVRRLRPWGVDVSSGVEAAPGRKDPEKVRRFVAAARAALSPTR